MFALEGSRSLASEFNWSLMIFIIIREVLIYPDNIVTPVKEITQLRSIFIKIIIEHFSKI